MRPQATPTIASTPLWTPPRPSERPSHRSPLRRPELVDPGLPLRVRLFGGGLSSASWQQVLNGANLVAVGDPADPGGWELLQFRDAELAAPDTYDLSMRLRGQLGTDGTMPMTWPVGSTFVLIDPSLTLLDLPSSARGLERHMRIGPAAKAPDDPSYVHEVRAFEGVGLRPYAPAHLRARWIGGDLTLGWIRRTRIDGDRWDLPDVPLGETSETYQVRVVRAGQVLREAVVAKPAWVYPAELRQEDGAVPPFDVQVAQVSERFGPGSFARSTIAGTDAASA